MPALSPVRLDLFKAAVYDAAAAVLGTQAELIWGDQGVPRPGRPYVALRILSGPTRADGTIHDIRQMRSAPTSVSATLASVVSGTRYRLRLNAQPFDETATGVSTVNSVRDAHIALINASSQPVTASSGGAGKVTLTPDHVGAILEVEATPTTPYTVTPTGEKFVIDYTSPRRIVVTFDVFVGQGLTELGPLDVGAYAIDLATQLETGFCIETTRQLLMNRRVSYFGPAAAPINLTGTAATLNEGRASVDLTFGVAAWRVEEVDIIEQAETTVAIDGLGFTTITDTTP